MQNFPTQQASVDYFLSYDYKQKYIYIHKKQAVDVSACHETHELLIEYKTSERVNFISR